MNQAAGVAGGPRGGGGGGGGGGTGGLHLSSERQRRSRASTCHLGSCKQRRLDRRVKLPSRSLG